MKRNIFGKHRLPEIQPLADYLYFPCRIQMRRRSLQRQIQMDSTQIHKQEWMFSDRNALRKVWPLANSSTLYTSPPAYKYIPCIQIHFFAYTLGNTDLLLTLSWGDGKQHWKATFNHPVMMMMVMIRWWSLQLGYRRWWWWRWRGGCSLQIWPLSIHHYPYLVCKRVSPIDVITGGKSTTIFLCIGPLSATFGVVTNKQLGDPRASLLLSSEKAVLCNRDDGDEDDLSVANSTT